MPVAVVRLADRWRTVTLSRTSVGVRVRRVLGQSSTIRAAVERQRIEELTTTIDEVDKAEIR